tara:strand:+ start:193 stop:1650 length:1458 start_codon:yes stop_codon:yes gene_type:complete
MEFMSKHLTGDTKFTAQVKILLNKIYGRSPLKDSVLERAIAYYDLEQLSQRKLDKLKSDIESLGQAGNAKNQTKLSNLEREQREYLQEIAFERNERSQHLQQICQEIIELCEGDNFAETNRKSAQLLGTIQLLAPTEGSKVAIVNERSKPLYKAILSLRLLDQVCLKQLLPDTYLGQELAQISAFNFQELRNESEVAYRQFVDRVKIPLLMAAILQDIGNNHPDAEKIMFGVNGKQDNYRTLKVEERKALLQINYRETLKYLLNGIGAAIYLGNSKAERDLFNKAENRKLRFIKELLKGSVNPKLGIGNLLKIPQIYTSIVLSIKESYNYKLLPKVYHALYQNAERGSCSRSIVDTLYQITGDFPQGFGVVYIPHDVEQEVRYEYAIVSQLYPENANEPICRIATRNLTFIGYGHDLLVKKSSNLYYVETAREFSSISKERLNEILELLSSNYLERKQLDLLPRCWQPGEFFSIQANQKLWNRAR